MVQSVVHLLWVNDLEDTTQIKDESVHLATRTLP
jgi:hypothetical protein